MRRNWLIGLGVIGIGVILLCFLYVRSQEEVLPVTTVSNFDECSNAGYQITKSDPEECRTPDGKVFVREIQEEPIVNNGVPPTPTPTPIPTGVGYVTGHVTIGPFCPVEREGVPCDVPPEAYSSRSVVVYHGAQVTYFPIDSNGNFKIELSPGTYQLQIKPAGIGEGEKKSVTVRTNATSTVDFDIDTGIR